jgi:hypothetical protein
MKENARLNREITNPESGAALVTVIMISVLLGIACIALLSSVGANSKNSTDVLSETKAYYAAESGLQATINVLRNTTITYSQADSSGTLSGGGWLTYNYPTSGPADRVVIGESAGTYNPNTGAAYSIFVTDPDNSGDSLTFYTSGVFQSYSVAGQFTISGNGKTIYICAVAPCDVASTRTEYSFTDAPSTTVSFATTPANPSLGSFTRTDVNGGYDIGANEIKFQIDYHLSAPRTALRNMRGSIKKSGSNYNVTFQAQNYELIGSSIELCSGTTGGPGCSDVTLTLPSGTAVSFYAYLTPVEPYRLKVLSTGYGPNGARKQLEGVIQKNFFNDSDAPAPLMMQGPNAQFNGTSAAYNIDGVDNVNGITIPSVGVTDSASLTNVQGCNCNPAPAVVTDVPDWMATPQNLNTLVGQLRTTAINSGRYFNNPTEKLTNTGDYTNGTGITFCDGSCEIKNNADGGGILVVTGTLYSDIWRFKGLIIITGAGGWERVGGGNRTVIGNVVIAPYDPNNLAGGFLSPYYNCQGCGNSLIDYDPIALDNAFSGTKSISNFMLGVAEK